MAETQVSIRIDLESGGRIGPGKIALLEAIRETGSITAAARSMQMSHRRAWLLVDELNKLLSEPVVTTAVGDPTHGSTHLHQSEKRPSRFTTQSKRTLGLPRAPNFRLFGN
jgi:molybdate transport system regulatory protein